ncbi:MAG: hypothetical protein WBQ94_06110 [Terracidiphilus sp.]
MTPNFAIIGIQTPHFHWPNLWLPVFLLWIPFLLLSPFILLVVLGVCVAGRINPWYAIATFWAILCSLPGTHVRVTTDDTQVLVQIL